MDSILQPGIGMALLDCGYLSSYYAMTVNITIINTVTVTIAIDTTN